MATNHDIINELRKSYAMELETVQNYLANSIDLDGVRAEEIKKALLGDIEEELGHARKLGNRIKVLEGRVPGSLDLDRAQRYLQPPRDSTDLIAVIRGVIRAEEQALDQYKKIIKMCDPIDLVTQDLILEITAQEQAHRRQFIGFLYEYERGEAKRLTAAAAYQVNQTRFWQCAQNHAVRPPIVDDLSSRPQRGHFPRFPRYGRSHDLGIWFTSALAAIASSKM
jgi:bacterioferritin